MRAAETRQQQNNEMLGALNSIRSGMTNQSGLKAIEADLKYENNPSFCRTLFFCTIKLWYDHDKNLYASLMSRRPAISISPDLVEKTPFLQQLYYYLVYHELRAMNDTSLRERLNLIIESRSCDSNDLRMSEEEKISDDELFAQMKPRMTEVIDTLKPLVDEHLRSDELSNQFQGAFKTLLKFHFGGMIEDVTTDLVRILYNHDQERFRTLIQTDIADGKGYGLSDIRPDEITSYVERSLSFVLAPNQAAVNDDQVPGRY